MKALYADFEAKPQQREKYYAFNVLHIRKFGQRIVSMANNVI